VSIYGAETIGTAILILLGDGVVAATLLARSKAENGGWIVITFGWAMGVAMAVYAVGAFSGAHLNPAVTLGFAVVGVTEWGDVPKYLAGEFSGAFIGAVLVWVAYLNHWRPTEDPGLKLAVFCTAPAIRNTVNNILTEIIAVEHAAALRNRAAFFDTFAAMGGADRMHAWFTAEPRLAYKDHVHFTDLGYQAWADALSSAVLAEYARWRDLQHLPATAPVEPPPARPSDAALPGGS